MLISRKKPPTTPGLPEGLSLEQLRERIDACRELPSLRRIGESLRERLSEDASTASEIAEVVERDPSLAARVLQMVNSAFFGLARRVEHIEDAVFYLGLRQIRELALSLPVIDEAASLCAGSSNQATWQAFWEHSLAVAMANREIHALAGFSQERDLGYVSGLVHNIGHLVLSQILPSAFTASIASAPVDTPGTFAGQERERIGWDHAQVGALYLRRHQLSAEVVEAVEFHVGPSLATEHPRFSASLELADLLARCSGLTGAEPIDIPSPQAWEASPSWEVVFPAPELSDRARLRLERFVGKLPLLVDLLQ
ncbi:MAG: HDOD domain-containing protein [Opitutales bacterium]